MLLDRTDVVIRAHEVGQGLTDRERIALGATLIQTVISPRYHPEMAYVAGQLRTHADALRDAHFDLGNPDEPHIGQTTTHEQTGSSGSCGDHSPPQSSQAVRPAPEGRTAWDRIATLSDSLDDHPLGHGIGAFCVFVIGLCLLFAPFFLPI